MKWEIKSKKHSEIYPRWSVHTLRFQTTTFKKNNRKQLIFKQQLCVCVCVCVILTRRSCRCWAASGSSLEPAISEAPLLPSAWRLNPGSDPQRPRPVRTPGLRGLGQSKCSGRPHHRELACGLTSGNPESTRRATISFTAAGGTESETLLLFGG